MSRAADASNPPPAERSESGRDRVALALLFAALAIGALRFARLDEWSLWIDEAYTLADAPRAFAFRNPLGYWIWSHWIAAAPGAVDERWLRLPAALFGWLGIPLCYWAFRPLIGARAAAAAALLLAASSWHAYWSQTARFYTLAQSLSLVGAGLWLRSLERGGLPRAALGWVLIGTSVFVHPSAGGLLPALFVAPWLLHWAGLRWSELRWPAPGLPVLRATAWIAGLAALPALWWGSRILRSWGTLKGGGDPAHFVLATGFQATPLLLAGVLCVLVFAVRARARAVLLLATTGVLFLAVALVASPFVRVTAQYAFLALPWLCAAAASVLAPVLCRAERSLHATALYGLILLPALTQLGLYFTVRRGERPAWRDAYRYVYEHREGSDLVLGMEAPVGEYYLAGQSADPRHPRALGWLDSWRADVPGQWSRYPRRTWFVVNPEQLEDWKNRELRADFEEMLRTDCRMVACWPLYVESRDLSVWVYVRDP
jgi:hypothetical protein